MGEAGPKGDRGERGLQGPKGDQGIPGPKGADGKTQYTHIAYANSSDGKKDFSTSDSNREYIGIYVDFNIDDSTNPSDYSWTLIKGADGEQGVPGPKGEDGKTPYLHTAWAYSADGNDRFTKVYPNLNLLEGTATFDKMIPNSSDNSVSSITKTTVLGIDNTVMDVQTSGNAFAVGFYTQKGYNITAGQTITISFMARASSNTSLFVGFEHFPNGHKMFTISTKWELYTYTFTATTSGTPGFVIYGWDMVAGQSFQVYNHKAEEGSVATPWMPSDSEVKTSDYPKYIGQYTNYTQVDSPNPSDYTWSLIRGNDGPQGPKGDKGERGPKGDRGNDGIAGKDGVGLKTTTITYGLSDSDSTQPTDWTSQPPSLVKGKYLWTKTVWTYTDSSSETGYQKTYIAKDGNDGHDGIAGKDGVGIRNTTITYASGTSGTTAPASGWSSQVPNVPAGQYLWTKTVWDYTDNTSETGYSVAKMGEAGPKGDRGERGLQGADGRTQYTHIAYADTISGSGFSQTDHTKAYIGMYQDFNATDSNNPMDYRWTKWRGSDGRDGIPGKPGADGRTPYVHFAYADSQDGHTGFSVTQNGRKRYLGVYTDFNQADSTNPDDYTWNDTAGSVSVGGRNLLNGSKGPFKPDRKPTDFDNYVYYENETSVYLEQGKQYIISAKTDGNFTDFHNPGSESDNVTLWLFHFWEVVDVVSDSKTGTTGTRFTWNHPTGTYHLRVNTYHKTATKSVWEVKIEEGTVKTDWTPSVDDVQDEIDSKADDVLTQSQLNKLNEMNSIIKAELAAKASLDVLDQWKQAYQDFVNSNAANRAQAQKALADTSARVMKLENNLNDMSERWNFIDSYMTASNEGLVVGKTDNSSSMLFSPNGRISMFSAGHEVMYISQGVIHIENGIFSKTIQIGNYREEQDLINPDRNVIRYVGGA